MATPDLHVESGELLDSVPIARLIPDGPKAEKALNDLLNYPDLSTHHRSFIDAERILRGEPSLTESGNADSGLNSEPETPGTPISEAWIGSYSLNFNTAPSRGWRIGRGSSRLGDERGVDLLLCRPGRKTRSGVAALQALIQLHPQSGVLMLVGLSESHPVEYLVDYHRSPILLWHGEKHVLHQRVNRFALGKLCYRIVYEEFTDKAKMEDYLRNRDADFLALGRPVPHPYLYTIPQDSQDECHRLGTVDLHRRMSSGTFGLVYAAVDRRSGDPLAVKELIIKNKSMSEHEDLKNELEIADTFRGQRGLLQIDSIRCNHGYSRPCGEYPEHLYLISPLASRDFSSQEWSSIPLTVIIELIKGPLQGLQALHETGFMHRDVTAKNLLIFTLDPPKAVLCDYGKARRSLKETDSKIGPIPTLAPEVNGFREYTNKIDIWGVGYVCCSILFPEYMRANVDITKPPNRNVAWYMGLRDQFDTYRKRGPSEKNFGKLVADMLSWEPRARPTAAQVLQRPCMQPQLPPKNDATSNPGPEAKVVRTARYS